MTEAERKRIERIMSEATGDPAKKVVPKRIYPDDALFLVEIIWELLKEVEAWKGE